MSYSQQYVGKHPGLFFFNKVISKENVKQSEMAELLGISTGYLDDFVKGKRNLFDTFATNIEYCYDEKYGITAKDLKELQKRYNDKIQQT